MKEVKNILIIIFTCFFAISLIMFGIVAIGIWTYPEVEIVKEVKNINNIAIINDEEFKINGYEVLNNGRIILYVDLNNGQKTSFEVDIDCCQIK